MQSEEVQQHKRVIFFVKSLRFLRYFKSVLYGFLRRGYGVLVVFDASKVEDPADDSLQRLKKEFPAFDWKNGPLRRDLWARLLIPSRNIMNYRFLLLKDTVPRHLKRLFDYLPSILKSLIVSNEALMHAVVRSHLTGLICKAIEWLSPSNRRISQFIADYGPHAILICYRSFPCLSPDIDYIKSGKSLGIPTAIITPSWDHLTTKALIQIMPQKIFVWNTEHQESAIKYHHVSPEIISVIGAPQFDAWFERHTPEKNREEFSKKFSLDQNKKFLLYIASVSAGVRNAPFIKELREILDRSSDPRICNIALLVRPYPGHDTKSEAGEIRNVHMLPAPTESRRTLNDDMIFYDSVFHSFATVALDSAAFLDSMTIGRPCIAYLDPKFADIQSAEHFSSLIGCGALYAVHSADEFQSTISRLIRDEDVLRPTRASYLSEFIRPRGFQKSVGEEVVREMVELIEQPLSRI